VTPNCNRICQERHCCDSGLCQERLLGLCTTTVYVKRGIVGTLVYVKRDFWDCVRQPFVKRGTVGTVVYVKRDAVSILLYVKRDTFETVRQPLMSRETPLILYDNRLCQERHCWDWFMSRETLLGLWFMSREALLGLWFMLRETLWILVYVKRDTFETTTTVYAKRGVVGTLKDSRLYQETTAGMCGGNRLHRDTLLEQ
jgi:hypothetical protein